VEDGVGAAIRARRFRVHDGDARQLAQDAQCVGL
jgi:hypothetical protein